MTKYFIDTIPAYYEITAAKNNFRGSLSERTKKKRRL
jgi:hypothetical protein